MLENALIVPILHILKNTDIAISEHTLIQLLEKQNITFPEEESNEMKLFKKHFLVMNALYQLQKELLEDNYLLTITSLAIKLDKIEQRSDKTELIDDTDIKLSEYYLDWDNYTNTTKEDVESLLKGFWDRYFAFDQQAQALSVLDLDGSSDWEAISYSYRQKINQYHPDKGGDQSKFIEIKEAYEILKRCYVKA